MSDATPTPPGDGRAGEPAARWGSLFQQSTDAVFILNRRRRLRFVNRAWETLTGQSADVAVGLFCVPRAKNLERQLQALARTLAPPPEVKDGRAIVVRRPVPPARLGPPWWDIQFTALADTRGLLAVVGKITLIGPAPVAARGPGPLSEGLAMLRRRAAARYSLALIESSQPAMQRLAAQARAAAQSRSPVWLVGEPGTGKETLARIIHHEGITREQSFLAIDCAGLQPFLVRNMLFGHAGLADSGRLGTVYLKDPGSMPADVQDEFVEWSLGLDAGPRVTIGSRNEPAAEFRAGRVSAEMLTSFAVLEIQVPPLRERRDDLGRLIEALAPKGAALTPAVRDLFKSYAWPGNLRELRTVLQESSALAAESTIDVGHLPIRLRQNATQAEAMRDRPGTANPVSLSLKVILEQVERNTIRLALKKAKGNLTDAAEMLGIPRAQLRGRLKKLGIEVE